MKTRMQLAACAVLLICVSVAVHRASAEDVDAPRKIRIVGVEKPKPKAPTSCGDNKNKHDCMHLGAQEGACAWCAGDYMPGSCVSTFAAKYIPETVAKCKLPKKAEQLTASQEDNKKNPCKVNQAEDACLAAKDTECAWCAGKYIPEGKCLPSSKAKFMPEMIAECKFPETNGDDDEEEILMDVDKKTEAASCDDNKIEDDCLDSKDPACAWCAGNYITGKCMSSFAAKFIPSIIAECKSAEKDDDDEEDDTADVDKPKPKPKAPTSCGDNKNKHDCMHLGAQEGACAWCAGDYMPGSCVSTWAAKYIPDTVAKCKLPKKDDAVEPDVVKASGGGYGPGGGDWPSGGGGQGGCMDLKSKKKCLKGDKDEACAWCSSSYMGDTCISESQVDYYKYFAKCKIGKKHKKHHKKNDLVVS